VPRGSPSYSGAVCGVKRSHPHRSEKGDHIIAPNVCTRESQIYTNARLFMPPVPWGVSGDHLSYRYHEEHLSTQDNPCYLGVIRNFKIASTACAWEERYPPQNCYLYGIQSLGASVSQLWWLVPVSLMLPCPPSLLLPCFPTFAGCTVY
jgi:hypothetical protein